MPLIMPSANSPEQAGGQHRSPLISVVLPVYNGRSTLERALRSVSDQTFADWELLAVDDGSTDDSPAILQAWAERDARIRPHRLPENNGQCAARNFGIRHSNGEIICYLDQDDEYFSDYLSTVDRHRHKGNVLVSRYDLVYDDAPPGTPAKTWQPELVAGAMFLQSIATLLGMAHQRALIERVGGFNELLWNNEDWDLWRRFARTGASFTFLASKSGRCHARKQSQSRVCRLTRKQQETFAANQRAGKPLFGDRPHHVSHRKIKKIVFVSPHSIVDFYNGAAIATVHSLQLLQRQGFECQAFCGSRLDAPDESQLEEQLDRQQAPYESRQAKIGDYEGRMVFSLLGDLPVTSFGAASTRGQWRDDAEIAAFLTAFSLFLDKNHPDVVLTYGGDRVSLSMMKEVKRRDIPIVFNLHNFQYAHPAPFLRADYVTVPSEFGRQHYWETLGLACQRLPNVVDWQRVQVSDRQPRYVTFVNPHVVKGVFVFARIAEVLARRRPDILFLIVEGRGKVNWLQQTGLDLSAMSNLHYLPITPDPRSFYRISKLVLVPSVVNEAFGLVAAEAMVNGIPVLASNCGALPETVGDDGFLFDVPGRYTATSRELPSAEEVEPWVETIIRLWDSASLYEEASQAARSRADSWRTERIVPVYNEFFNGIFPQPGPPLVPRACMEGTERD
jgi:glycosyltransferase involved in cell wall biosynthesis